MAAMSPLAVLDRGYAIVKRGDDVIRDPAQVTAGEQLRVRVARGEISVTVDEDES
jgi:exodeoxyribonuclease VII large subunit